MSIPDSLETDILIYSKEDKWNSAESIITQQITKLTRSDSVVKIPTKFSSDVTFSEKELREINVEETQPLAKWDLSSNKTRFPRVIQTKSLLRDELDMLKINMSMNEKIVTLRESQLLKEMQKEAKRRNRKAMLWCTPPKCIQKIMSYKVRDLISEIEGSESAKTDTVVWKFLKRGPSLRKDFVNARTFLMEIQAANLQDSHIRNTQPARVTCPNCRFFITTKIKRISTIRTKLTSFFLTIIGLCIIPHVFYAFKDTVHLCPLCKIYLGFCPAFGIKSRKRESRTREFGHIDSVPVKEREKLEVEKQKKKMVSASSTSAKNLFVESKLRLSDRVQVNVNNIAAVARQIQRGSKSNENLILAAKNFALQEAAIENSETNLKKLKLLTTHLNNQIDSLQNSCSKMELVLEQVRSMQR